MPRVKSIAAMFVSSLLLVGLASCGGSDDSTDAPEGSPSGSNATTAESGESSDAEVGDSSNGSSHSGGSATITAWELVTEDDLNTITGETYTRLESQGDFAYMKHCSYWDSTQSEVSVTAHFANAQSVYDGFQQFPELQAVEGIGDQATWCAGLDTLCVLSGNKAVEVRFRQNGTDATQRLEAATTIASLVLDRI